MLDMWGRRFGFRPLLRGLAVFAGGVLAIIGARMAGGCPGGHGPSGTVQLALGNLISLAFLFVGGIVTARLVYGKGETGARSSSLVTLTAAISSGLPALSSPAWPCCAGSNATKGESSSLIGMTWSNRNALLEGGSPLSNGRTLAERIGRAKRVVAFTGAGMSTESGLADFRSSRGHWKRYDPLAMASVEALQSRSPAFYDFYRMRIEALSGVEPHQGHRVLARWEDEGRLQAVITQNVDRLHQAAGSRRVVELHGNLREVSCTQCRQRFASTVLLERVDCALCGGALRPAVVLFGEHLPGGPFAESEELAESCDLLLVLGSSLTVSPANVFPGIAQSGGADLVIVNRGATPYDGRADLVIDGAIGEVLAAADGCLREAGHAGGQEG